MRLKHNGVESRLRVANGATDGGSERVAPFNAVQEPGMRVVEAPVGVDERS